MRGLPLVCVQPLVSHMAREQEDLTGDKTDEGDSGLIARLARELHCYVPERLEGAWAELREEGRRRAQLITNATAAKQLLRDKLGLVAQALLEAACEPFDSATWLASLEVVLERSADPPADVSAETPAAPAADPLAADAPAVRTSSDWPTAWSPSRSRSWRPRWPVPMTRRCTRSWCTPAPACSPGPPPRPRSPPAFPRKRPRPRRGSPVTRRTRPGATSRTARRSACPPRRCSAAPPCLDAPRRGRRDARPGPTPPSAERRDPPRRPGTGQVPVPVPGLRVPPGRPAPHPALEPTAAAPTWPTWSACAPTTTSWSTTAATSSPLRPAAARFAFYHPDGTAAAGQPAPARARRQHRRLPTTRTSPRRRSSRPGTASDSTWTTPSTSASPTPGPGKNGGPHQDGDPASRGRVTVYEPEDWAERIRQYLEHTPRRTGPTLIPIQV